MTAYGKGAIFTLMQKKQLDKKPGNSRVFYCLKWKIES